MAFNFEALLVLLVAAVAFLLLRMVFSTGESHDVYAESKHRIAQSLIPRSFDDKARNAPISNDLGRVQVARFNFAHFDALPGPLDPECFADELILELYDSVSDFRWTATYVVATPAGIRKLMDEERWNFFYATEIFVVRRYDLQIIREAVYGRIKEVHDQVPLDAEEPPIRG
jgi:hypothetical protein